MHKFVVDAIISTQTSACFTGDQTRKRQPTRCGIFLALIVKITLLPKDCRSQTKDDFTGDRETKSTDVVGGNHPPEWGVQIWQPLAKWCIPLHFCGRGT